LHCQAQLVAQLDKSEGLAEGKTDLEGPNEPITYQPIHLIPQADVQPTQRDRHYQCQRREHVEETQG